MQRAQGYAGHAVEQLKALLSGPNAADFDERRAALTGKVQYILGLTRLRLEEWGHAADAFKAAVEAVPDDPMFYFMMKSSI
jgi:hypothetical protein